MSRLSVLSLLAASVLSLICSSAAGGPQTAMAPMGDGVKLATDVYLPEGNRPFPVVLVRTPYGREEVGGRQAKAGVASGVAMVFQDMRGRFGSEGENLPFLGCGWADHQDGADTIAWILKQDWCNGRVGTMGASASGITQNLMAGAAPKGLTAQFLKVAAVNLYADAAYVGGALRKEQVENWTIQNRFDPNSLLLWGRHTLYDEYWTKLDATTRFGVMNVPAIHMGGWFDTFAQATIDSFVGRQYQGAEGGKGKQKLVMGPWAHEGSQPGGKVGDLAFPHAETPRQYSESRWFQYHLMGVDNGVMKEPAVFYYVMGDTKDAQAPGNEWRSADAWPVPTTAAPYYFHKDGRLAGVKPTTSDDFREYTFDPNAPCPTLGGKNLTIQRGPMNQNPIEGRKDVLLFTTDPLDAPTEVTGRVAAKVFVSSSAADTDLSVRLCDVYPDGKSYEMAEGILRLRHREGYSKEAPLTAGQIYDVTVDCWSTSIIFNKGHRIRVIVTSSNFPRFDLNPGTGKPWRDGGNFLKQTNRIYCDSEHPSSAILPVNTAGPKK